MTKERCKTCTRWRRGFRGTPPSYAWVQNWQDGRRVEFGACRLLPSVWAGNDWEQSRMHEDDWCTEYQSIIPNDMP